MAVCELAVGLFVDAVVGVRSLGKEVFEERPNRGCGKRPGEGTVFGQQVLRPKDR